MPYFLAILTFFWVLRYAWVRRDMNRETPGSHRYRGLGLANAITLTRGLLLPVLAALCALPASPESAWLGGSLYLTFILFDFLDGLAARLTRRTSLLGKALDMHYDGLGVLLAATLLVRLGRAPGWYALAGLAWPLSRLAEAVLSRMGRIRQPLAESSLRRTLAGLQMGFLALALPPLFPAAATRGLATLFLIPFLTHFLADLWQVAGRPWPAMPKVWQTRLCTLSRLAAAGGLLLAGWRGTLLPPPVAFIAGILLGAGILPRVTAAAALLALVSVPASAYPDATFWLLAALLLIPLHFGAGQGLLWAPDERLFRERLG